MLNQEAAVSINLALTGTGKSKVPGKSVASPQSLHCQSEGLSGFKGEFVHKLLELNSQLGKFFGGGANLADASAAVLHPLADPLDVGRNLIGAGSQGDNAVGDFIGGRLEIGRAHV